VGTVNSIRAKSGTSADWSLAAAGKVNTLDAGNGSLGGTVQGAYFNRITTRGDLTAAITATDAEDKRHIAIGSLTAGRVRDVSLNAVNGGINSLTVTEWLDGDGSGDGGTITADWKDNHPRRPPQGLSG